MSKVRICYQTIIPSEAVIFYVPVVGYGGTFNGGVKSTLTVDFNTENSSMSIIERSWHKTIYYPDGSATLVPGMPDWYGELNGSPTPKESATLALTDDNLSTSIEEDENGGFVVFFHVSGANPLLSLAPSIDAHLSVSVEENESGVISCYVRGSHDGFPNHVITANDTVIYLYDVVRENQSPLGLTSESVTVDTGWCFVG